MTNAVTQNPSIRRGGGQSDLSASSMLVLATMGRHLTMYGHGIHRKYCCAEPGQWPRACKR